MVPLPSFRVPSQIALPVRVDMIRYLFLSLNAYCVRSLSGTSFGILKLSFNYSLSLPGLEPGVLEFADRCRENITTLTREYLTPEIPTPPVSSVAGNDQHVATLGATDSREQSDNT